MADVRGMWQDGHMDINTLAKSIVDQATGDKPRRKPSNPKRVEAGKTRAKVLGTERVTEIARIGAEVRWRGKMKTEE